MNKITNIYSKNSRFIGLNKYQIIFIIGFSVLLFVFGSDNISTRISNSSQVRDLKNQINYYKEKVEIDKAKLTDLKTDKEGLEKFARDNFYMKKDNEDVFVIE